jgi:hypothetical protein
MAILTKVITASVGFAFTFGAFGKATAQEAKLAKNGTVVLARENRTPTMSNSSLEELRKSLSVLASNDAKAPGTTKGTKTKTKSPTKPSKKRKNI